MNNISISEIQDTSRIVFVLGIHANFNIDPDTQSNNITKQHATYFSDDAIVRLILEYMNNHRELEDISMTVAPIKGLYRYEYGCPESGENLYRVTSLYNPLYKQSKEDWKNTVLEYAKNLSEFFQQITCTVIIENYDKDHPLQFIYIKNKDDNRRML